MRKHFISALLLLFAVPLCLSAQSNDQELEALIIQKDSIFWRAYNNCDVQQMSGYVTADVEFYHDKGGMTTGINAMMETFRTNICSKREQFRLRREAVSGTLKVYPLKNAGVIYGAVISGEHLFYVQEKGKKERADGLARFTHLWLYENREWKMKRILSYDHAPAPYINKRVAVVLSDSILQTYAGKYAGPQTQAMYMKPDKGLLIMHINGKDFPLYPAGNHLFFSKDRDLTFEFLAGSNGTRQLTIREGDQTAEVLQLIQ
ncbi:nuclear transport factor 2 family protein [Chitinophaga solisilvae]|uniref:nuclear transport factor 2 family protein n=1 Tax=Chitinophaga solisilvae TaxID=1233460 RepID=UPI00136AEF87|nr:nuclear transport factor 2 family protein [Chitinophaga solisilvae]